MDWIVFVQVVGAVASIVTAVVAIAALQSWREQLLGSEGHLLAKKILLSTVSLQGRFAELRSRLSETSYEDWIRNPIDSRMSIGDKYHDRFSEYIQAMIDLQGLLVEGNILWNDEMNSHLSSMVEHAALLKDRLMDYLAIIGKNTDTVSMDEYQIIQRAFLGTPPDGAGELRESFLAYIHGIDKAVQVKMIGRKRSRLMKWIASLWARRSRSREQ